MPIDLFEVVVFVTVGLMGVLGLLVVYVARIVKHLKQIADSLKALPE